MKKSGWIYLSIIIIVLNIILGSCNKTIPDITTTNVTFGIMDGVSYVLTGGTILDDGGSNIKSRGVCWSSSPSPTINGSKDLDVHGDDKFDVGVPSQDFLRSTTYYLRAFATNSKGTAYGNQVSFTTPCVWTSETFFITLTSLTGISQSLNPTLSWSMLYNHYKSYRIEGDLVYTILYSVYLDTSSYPATRIATGLSNKSLTLSGLNPNTTYYWKVYGWQDSNPCNNATSIISKFSTGP